MPVHRLIPDWDSTHPVYIYFVDIVSPSGRNLKDTPLDIYCTAFHYDRKIPYAGRDRTGKVVGCSRISPVDSTADEADEHRWPAASPQDAGAGGAPDPPQLPSVPPASM